eukprot:1094409-Alexandrium_andersonii.AAC.1
MSASLVGSEMCIRDRITKPVAAVPKPAVSLAGSPSFRARPGGEQSWRSCLLYTSDAADDM